MKILMVTPYFPPYTGVASLRMGSLARFLLKTGHSLTIVKLSDSCYPAEEAGGTQVPGITYVEFSNEQNFKETALRLYSILEDLAMLDSFDCCLVSCGPYFTLEPVLRLWERFYIPFIVDYRDLWLYQPQPIKSLRMLFGRYKKRLLFHGLEKKVLNACSAFITCSPPPLQTMIDHYPFIKGKAFCVFNGYDFPKGMPAASLSSHSKGQEIQICNLGKLAYYSSRGARCLFLAAGSLIKKGYSIRIVHIGSAEPLQEIIRKTGFPQEYYKNLGLLPYEEAISAAASAHICVTICDYPIGLGTKLYDYIYLNKPVVAYVPKHSEFAEVLSKAENAFVCQSAEQMSSAFETIIAENRLTLTDNKAFAEQFSREDQNKKFLRILTEVAGKRNRG